VAQTKVAELAEATSNQTTTAQSAKLRGPHIVPELACKEMLHDITEKPAPGQRALYNLIEIAKINGLAPDRSPRISH
jgi:hypothetical protein